MSGKRDWLVDVLAGGLIGGVTGAIAAVNFVIFIGIEGGYEATIAEVFRQNIAIGILTVLILAAGPIVGVWLARRQRRRGERLNTSERVPSREKAYRDG